MVTATVTIRWATETDATAIAALDFFTQSTEFGTELSSFMHDPNTGTP